MTLDITEGYLDVPQSQVGAVALRIQDCLKDVVDWCGARTLQLNVGKTNVMWSVRLIYNASTTIAFYHQRRR